MQALYVGMLIADCTKLTMLCINKCQYTPRSSVSQHCTRIIVVNGGETGPYHILSKVNILNC